MDTNLYWVRKNGGNWNNDPTANPTLLTGGYDIGLTTGSLMAPMVSVNNGHCVANFGQNAFKQTVPTGYFAGWPNTSFSGWTTLDPASVYNVSTPGTLSNGNLTATGNGLTQSAWFASDFHGIGQYYFEVTFTNGSLSYKTGTGVGAFGAQLLYCMLGNGDYSAPTGTPPNRHAGGGNITFDPLITSCAVGICGNSISVPALCPGYGATVDTMCVAVALYTNVIGVAATPQIGQPTTLVVNSAKEAMSLLSCVQQPITDHTMVTLQWSDDAGASWSNGLEQSLGEIGEYLTSIQFRRLGMARNRVFRVYWSGPKVTALTGLTIQFEIAGT